MIVQTGVEFKSDYWFKPPSDYGFKPPSDFRLYDIPDTHEKLVNVVAREHIRQLIQQVAVRLVATFKKEQQKLKFVSSKYGLPDPNRLVVIKTEPFYDGDTDIYNINRRVPCYCGRYFRGECIDIKWEHPFSEYEPFEWCYLNLEQ